MRRGGADAAAEVEAPARIEMATHLCTALSATISRPRSLVGETSDTAPSTAGPSSVTSIWAITEATSIAAGIPQVTAIEAADVTAVPAAWLAAAVKALEGQR